MISGTESPRRRDPRGAAQAGEASPQPPLVVDLDRDLLRTNLAHEAVTALLLSHPLAAVAALGAGARGGLGLRAEAANAVQIDPATLPYEPEALQLLLKEHAHGRRLVLTAGASRPWAQAVANHLGIFDEVVADGAGPAVPTTPESVMPTGPDPGAGRAPSRRGALPLRQIARALRPHQWLKNMLVFVALFTAQRIEHRSSVLDAVAMFVAFCLVSSSVYVLNDMADLTSDRRHVIKRTRPFASGDLGVLAGWGLWPLLAGCGVLLASLTLPLTACLWLLAYYTGTLLYTFGAKRQAVLDVIVLAGLYTVRIIAGAAAISVPTSIWLLTFSMSIFTSLALVKRVSELTRVIESGGTLNGRGYEPRDLGTLKSLGVTAAYAAVVVLALYVHDPGTAHLYRTPSILWLVVPLMLYWSSRLWLLADRGEIDEDPVLFAARDRVSYIVLLVTAAAFAAAKFVG